MEIRKDDYEMISRHSFTKQHTGTLRFDNYGLLLRIRGRGIAVDTFLYEYDDTFVWMRKWGDGEQTLDAMSGT